MLKKTGCIILVCFLLAFSVDRRKASQESHFYKLLLNKEWSVQVNGIGTDMDFSQTVQKLTLEKVVMDSINSKVEKENNKFIQYSIIVLTFQSNDSLRYRMDAKGFARCGNGAMNVKKGKWSLDSNRLCIDISGTICCESTFRNKVEYEITSSDTNHIQLRKVKDIVSEYKRVR